MLAPLALYFIQGEMITSLSSTLALFAPLALCAGMHFVLHRSIGRSCHGGTAEAEQKIIEEPKRSVFADR